MRKECVLQAPEGMWPHGLSSFFSLRVLSFMEPSETHVTCFSLFAFSFWFFFFFCGNWLIEGVLWFDHRWWEEQSYEEVGEGFREFEAVQGRLVGAWKPLCSHWWLHWGFPCCQPCSFSQGSQSRGEVFFFQF